MPSIDPSREDLDRGAPLPNNTHIHLPPNFSAFDTVEQAVDMAVAEGIRALGCSNYYDYTVYRRFGQLARAAGVHPLFGTEIICLVEDLARAGRRINDPANPGKMYICGKGISRFDPLSARGAALLQTIRDKDSMRMAEMIQRLDEVFSAAGFNSGVTEATAVEMVVRRHGAPRKTVCLQERHIAQAFQETFAARLTADEMEALLTRAYGVAPAAPTDNAVATQNEIRSRLMKAGTPGYVPETFVGYDHARQLILALGGIPCYPTLADAVTPATDFEETPAALVERVRQLDIHCAEFIPVRNSPETLEAYVLAMRRAGIIVTAGTEHNTRDLIPLTPTCRGGAPVPESAARIFWEGACVVAAHGDRVARGLEGYVDPRGRRPGGDADIEQRLRSFAAEGQAILAG